MIIKSMSTLPGTLHSAHNGTWQVAEHGCQVLAWQADDKPVIWFDAEHADESEAVIREESRCVPRGLVTAPTMIRTPSMV